MQPTWINVETDQRIKPFRTNLRVLDNCAVCNVAVLLLFTRQRVFNIPKVCIIDLSSTDFIRRFLNRQSARGSVCIWRIAVSFATILAKCCLMLRIAPLIS